MKIAVPSPGRTLESSIDGRFGRAAGFIVYNTEDGSFTLADNGQNMNAGQGAGVQAAQNIAATGADVVIAPSFGPKAFQVLKAAGVKMVFSIVGTVKENIESFIAGKLKETDNANVEGHW
ncbi:MAG: NifB/NifX family molybdenum-iron cluster-binding protein [Candidatus Fermentibacteraceae bacterium]|nr:NifB/NifX family molybdenum-iron cluster-binding protein [Candidatus Fermentibacteraceae bacterium]